MNNSISSILNKKEYKNYIEYLLPFVTLLAPYSIGPFSFFSIGLMIVCFLSVYHSGGRIRLSRKVTPFLYMFIFALTSDTVRMIMNIEQYTSHLFRLMEYSVHFILVFIVMSMPTDEDKLYKVWKAAGTVYALGLLYHLVMIYVFKKTISPISIIPGYVIRENISGTRPTSFFSEPAAFVNAMIPLEFLAIKRKDYSTAVITTLIILASTSTVGVVLSAVLWLLLLFRKKGIKKNARIGLILVILLITAVFTRVSFFKNSYDKFVEASNGGSTVSSRIIISFEVVKSESITEILFGTKYNNIQSYLADNYERFSAQSDTIKHWDGGNGYIFLNTFAQLMFRYGIFALIIYFLPLIQYLKNPKYQGRDFAILVIIATFAQTMLLNSHYFVNIILLLFYAGKEEAINE